MHFVSPGKGIFGMNDTEAYTLYVFVFAFFLVALYVYMVVSRKELLFSLKRAGALMAIFTFVVVVNIVVVAFNPYLICVALTSMLVLPFSKRSDAFVLNAFSCWISSFVLIATLDYSQFPAVAFTLLAGMICNVLVPVGHDARRVCIAFVRYGRCHVVGVRRVAVHVQARL